MGTIADKLQKLLGTKADIRAAITAKGQSVADSLPFSRYPDKIRAIQTGTDTSDATAEAGHILSRKTAYSKGQKITGTIPSQAAQTITPGTTNKTIAAGRYLTGTQTIRGDANLTADNIKSGVSIFGITGSLLGVGQTVTVQGSGYEEISSDYTVGFGWGVTDAVVDRSKKQIVLHLSVEAYELSQRIGGTIDGIPIIIQL